VVPIGGGLAYLGKTQTPNLSKGVNREQAVITADGPGRLSSLYFLLDTGSD